MCPEQVPANETPFQDRLVELLRAKMERENPATMHRDAHPKQHGLVKARFEVEPNLPEHLRVGVFQAGATYQAWVRFSNQNAPPQADNVRDIRGAAIKLMNVPGTKLPMPDGNLTSQDFVTISTPVFVSRDVREFCRLIQALVGGKWALFWHFLRYPRSFVNLMRSNIRCSSPLQIRYWSTTPYQLGPDQIVKYSLIPQSPQTHESIAGTSYDYLREIMVKQLRETDYAFDFCVQLRTDTDRMPVEDPGKRWSETKSPFVKVATLTIPRQEFDSPAQRNYGLLLSFNPWHSMPEHQPLGGINRARKVIYDALSQFRHRCNQQARREPTDFGVPEVSSTPPNP